MSYSTKCTISPVGEQIQLRIEQHTTMPYIALLFLRLWDDVNALVEFA